MFNKHLSTKPRQIFWAVWFIVLFTSIYQYDIYVNDNVYFSKLAQSLRKNAKQDSSFVLAAMNQVYINLKKKQVLNPNLPAIDRLYLRFLNGGRARTYLEYKNCGYLSSPCSEYSRTLIAILKAGNVPSRRIRSDNHTLVEAFFNKKWRLLDPTFNFVWRLPNGDIAGFQEIRRDSLLLFQIKQRAPQYPYRFKTELRIAWERFPLPLLKHVFLIFYSQQEVAIWYTPHWMMRPAFLGATFSLCIAIAMFVCYILVHFVYVRRKTK